MQSVTIGRKNKTDYSTDAAYKMLMTQISLCGKEIKAIAFSSCNNEEGKTNVAFSLAKSFADNGKNVLFIDADMRNTVLVSRYKIGKASNGLSHFLAGVKELEEVIYQTDIDGLFIVTAGMLPEEPSRLVSSELFDRFIQAAREKFDYVIVDTPSLREGEDAKIIGSVCDGLCLVVAPNKVGCKKLAGIKDELKAADCELLGVVMNKVKKTNKDK